MIRAIYLKKQQKRILLSAKSILSYSIDNTIHICMCVWSGILFQVLLYKVVCFLIVFIKILFFRNPDLKSILITAIIIHKRLLFCPSFSLLKTTFNFLKLVD